MRYRDYEKKILTSVTSGGIMDLVERVLVIVILVMVIIFLGHVAGIRL